MTCNRIAGQITADQQSTADGMSRQKLAKILAFQQALQQFQSMQCTVLNSCLLVHHCQNKESHAVKMRFLA